ncbi:MAG: CpsD/CapB family tyrosine-protein kinase [Acidobacteriota bacterium]|nr:CpsD/CapB family tyrosine-protein kinase [Acidobacteriota bacterium]MDE3168507.1 CpsD/CapB family tyrosine-protein kinase [Acidobacteriota bacterium]
MSRIHDALKKAEQERNTVEPARVESQAISTPVAEPTWNEIAPAASIPETLAPPAIVPPSIASDTYLRFEDLMARCAHPHWQLDPNMNVFSVGYSSRSAEQFRTLRSRLYQLRSNQPLRTILITSAVAAEGKTFVASNLAQSIVRQPDRRVLLIDADLRCARLHMPLGAPISPGLTDYLCGEKDEAAVIQSGNDSNLCLIAGGSEVTNPSELLLNGRFSTLINRVGSAFDWVIVDSPPCLPVADSTILAEACDAVLLVIRAGVTPSDIVRRAVQDFQSRNMIGVVLNAVENAQMYGSYYYPADKYLGETNPS